ncbi:MAG: SRPBCC family protein [Deltaproteobacteria bacterium]|nr:SRPBCC family protein [Deltaproteobacteria bacterium]
MPKAEHELDIHAPIERVFDVISDYEQYPEFLPEMREVRVLSRHDGVAVVQFELELVMRLSYTLRLTEERPHALTWTLEQAKMMSLNSGGWKLTAKDAKRTHATYGLEVKLRGLIPKSVSTRLIGTTLPATMERFKARAEALASG